MTSKDVNQSPAALPWADHPGLTKHCNEEDLHNLFQPDTDRDKSAVLRATFLEEKQFDAAVIGAHCCRGEGHVAAYEMGKLVNISADGKKSAKAIDDAREYLDFNTLRSVPSCPFSRGPIVVEDDASEHHMDGDEYLMIKNHLYRVLNSACDISADVQTTNPHFP